ncbi:hypothetical protein STANM309S_00852 [Streptomyces tanashiensis]
MPTRLRSSARSPTYAEPHCYDLCAEHSERLTAPRGLGGGAALRRGPPPPAPAATTSKRWPTRYGRRARPQERAAGGKGGGGRGGDPMEVGRRGHLRVLPFAADN